MSRLVSALLFSILVATAALTPRAHQAAQAQTPPQIEFRGQATIPGSGNIKFPQIRGKDAVVHVAGSGGSGNNNNPLYWRKNADGTTNFGNPADLGDVRGEPNYTVTDVTVAPGGRVYVIWNDTSSNAIYLLSSANGTSWDPNDRKTVIDDSTFRVYTRIGAANDRLWVVWNQDGRYRFRTTSDVSGGGGWSGTQLISGRESINQPSIAVSPNGSRTAVAYAISAGDIYVGIWNGSNFTERLISNTNQYLVDPTVAFGPDNRIWVAWRAVEGGIFFSREDDQGNFPASRIISAESYGTVSINVDPQGSPHVFWVGNRGDGWKAYYARQQDGVWGVSVADPGAFIVNGIGAVTVSDYAYGHGVTEYFSGSGLVTRYFLFRSLGSGCVAQTITVGNAVPGTDPPVVRDPFVTGAIAPSAGCTPAQQRVVLNAQDPNQPADPWVGAYNRTITSPEQCVQTVNVQLRANNRDQFDPQWRSITFVADPQSAGTPVDAAVQVMNPKNFGAMPSVFPPITPAGDLIEQGASAGDPGYTRINQMFLRVNDIGDCTGLVSYNIIRASDGTVASSATFPGAFAGNVPVPSQTQTGVLTPGGTEFAVQVIDRVSNTSNVDRIMFYDPPGNDGSGRPVMNQASFAPDTSTLTILRELTITQINVTDNLYRRGFSVPTRGYVNTQTPPDTSDATKQFWGLWIAVEYLGKGANPTTTYPPLPEGDLTRLRWQAVEVPDASGTPRVRFNLFDGVLDRTAATPTNGFGPDLTKDGTYRVYVKALDGAGNASVQTDSSLIFTLDPGYRVITRWLPIITR